MNVLPEQPINSTQSLQAKDLSLKSVTVFNDRAEIKREFQVTLKNGLNEIRIENVASTIDGDSIRIDGRGPATIHEVQFKNEPARQDEIDSDQVKALVQKLKEFEEKKARLDDLKETLKNRLKALDTLTTNFGKSSDNASAKFDDSAASSLDNLFEYHEKKNVEIRAKLREHEKEAEHVTEDINKTNNEINLLRASRYWKRSILVLLEAAEDDTKIDLELAYQVYSARWTPSYDVRVQTGDKTDGVKLKITYFGNIQQESGEDWKDVELALSTAQPRLGGMLPKLGTLNAQFYKPPPPPPERPVHAFRNVRSACAPAPQYECLMAIDAAPMDSIRHMEYTAEENVLSTTFTVPQRKTIPSDPSEHKVTIATIVLDAILHYDVVPKKNTNVFLTAASLNTSTYPLLSGMASIYVNNSFSTKTNIGPVYTSEKFDCPLGVDPSIKVQYKPVHKFQQQQGLINKISSTVNEQKIIVKNTKKDSVLLTIHEHVPKSTDEKIKVKLFTPEIKPTPTEDDSKALKLPDVGAKLNINHNLEWTILYAPDEEKELSVKWTIDYPPTETVEYNEAF